MILLSSGTTNSPWFNTRVIRNRITIEHETPYDRKFIEEITIINNDVNPVKDFPLPLIEFRQGLTILDEDNSILSFYSSDELDDIVTKLDRQLYEQIESVLSERYLVWVKFPDDKPIHPDELRTIRLTYQGPEDSPVVKNSLFDMPVFEETIPKSVYPFETFYFIKAPKDFVIEVDEKNTKTTFDRSDEELSITYLKKPASPTDFKDPVPTIKNRDCYISAKFPPNNRPYKTLLNYKIKLTFIERLIWRTVLPVTALILLGLIVYPNFLNDDVFKLTTQSLLVIAGSTITIASALIALVNNPLVRRTRALLFIHISLAIILIIKTGIL